MPKQPSRRRERKRTKEEWKTLVYWNARQRIDSEELLRAIVVVRPTRTLSAYRMYIVHVHPTIYKYSGHSLLIVFVFSLISTFFYTLARCNHNYFCEFTFHAAAVAVALRRIISWRIAFALAPAGPSLSHSVSLAFVCWRCVFGWAHKQPHSFHSLRVLYSILAC